MNRLLLPLLATFLSIAFAAQGQSPEETNRLARDIFKELIEINTTDSVGNVTQAAEAMAARLRAAGFAEKDVLVMGPNPKKRNLIARIHGSGKAKPILLLDSSSWASRRSGSTPRGLDHESV